MDEYTSIPDALHGLGLAPDAPLRFPWEDRKNAGVVLPLPAARELRDGVVRLERELLALTAPPADLTNSSVEARIVGEDYSYFGALTVCVLTLDNGFRVVGQAARSNPAKFIAEVGATLARKDAVRQLWAFEGYLLLERRWMASKAAAAIAQAADARAAVAFDAEVARTEGEAT